MGLAKIIMKTSLYVLIVHIFQKSCGVEIDFETKLSLAKDKDAPTGPWYPNFLKAEYIKPCYKADPNLTSCALNTFNHLRPYLKSGIKELNVPSVDPLKIDYLLMENGKGPIKVKAAFYNITTVGATNYTVTHIKPDIENLIIEVGVHLPKLDITGSYDVNGNVLLFPVRSKGDFWAVFTGVEGAAKVKGKEYTNEQNVRFMIVDHMAVDFRLKKTRFRIKDVINHGNILGEAMNQFINNNAEEIIKEMKPAANIAIAKHFKEFLNAAFGQIPLKVWLPDASSTSSKLL